MIAIGQPGMLDTAWNRQKRWVALLVVCLGALMIMLDTTIVNVALPSIRRDLRFTDNSLAWVVNAYTLTFGGSLLPGGHLGDLHGQRRLFLIGTALFTFASAACGMANTQFVLIAARAIQGFGGAVIIAVALSLIVEIFPDRLERAEAIGLYSFICTGGGSMGLLLGGALTSVLDWHWVFLVNLPVGPIVYLLARTLLPPPRSDNRADGWGARVPAPLVLFGVFRQRNVSVASIVASLWTASVSAWLFISTLYMQRSLGYSPMKVALAFLPSNIVTGAFALGFSAKLVNRVGIRLPLCLGMLLGAMGLALLAREPLGCSALGGILAAMILLGLGGGMAFNPLLLAAMSDVPPGNSGIASGVVSTASILGGGLGVVAVASSATAWTNHLLATGRPASPALLGGYQLSFLLGASFAITAAIIGGAFLRIVREVNLPESPDRLRSDPRIRRSG
jgi:predicted MFS family arabinose efflux permease